ncbi:MAG: hypothetical protein ACYTXT_19285 [Nostoc sp.]|uniref:hypothetical protein n=1 Tax=Nostoc sp. TaxID=1180 RepID=UPI002FF2F904
MLPVLGFGSVAYALDGYFLGLTQGHTLRQAMLKATVIGFFPSAIQQGISIIVIYYGYQCLYLWQQEQ